MSITITDVAREAKVSPATVFCVLNNKRINRISDKTRGRVLKTIRKLNYYPRAAARGLASNKTQTIGVGIHDIGYLTDTYFSTIITGISQTVGIYDYNLHFVTTDKKAQDSKKNLFFMRKVWEKRLDGLIIIDQDISDEDILELQRTGVPFVLIEKDVLNGEINCVLTDNKEGIFQATEHLIKLGHKRIGFIVEKRKFYKDKEMLKGYKLALNRYGLKYEGILIRESSPVLETDYKTVEELLQLRPRPTAIVTASDKIALRVLRTIKNLGLGVPRDVALIGYDDEPIIAHVEPHLTTVKIPLRKMGELAAEVLIKTIDGDEHTEPKIVLKPELVVRESCGGKIK